MIMLATPNEKKTKGKKKKKKCSCLPRWSARGKMIWKADCTVNSQTLQATETTIRENQMKRHVLSTSL